MKIIEIEENKDKLRFVVDSNEESLFTLLKVYLEKESDVEIVGVFREHHLLNKTEFLIKVKKGEAKDVLKKVLPKIKKEIQSMKVK